MALEVQRTLAELVAIPSVNPMGRPADGPHFFEARLTDHLQQLFAAHGLPFERQTVAPRRDNIIARLDGDPGRLVLFEVHQDTVPTDGMTVDPWNPKIGEGKLFGRGACDVKGTMSAMLVALTRLAEDRSADRATVLLACTVNEEHGFTGAAALADQLSGNATSIIPRRPDVCIVAEPTELQVVIAHKGVVRWRCRTNGRTAHSSQPKRGVNAIYKMSSVLTALAGYAEEVPTLANDPHCGHPTLSVGTITGGLSVNTVPEQCVIEIDRRLIPGEDPQIAYRHVVDHLGRQLDFEIEHEAPFLVSRPLTADGSSSLGSQLEQVVEASGIPCRQMGVAFGTDASVIAAAGVPAVVFGAGSIEQAHTADEWIDLEQVEQAAEVLYRFARTYNPQRLESSL